MQPRSARHQDKTSTNATNHAIHKTMDSLALDNPHSDDIEEEEKQLHASLREDEFLALEAIYPPEHVRVESSEGALSRVHFDLPISCSNPVDVEVVTEDSSELTATTATTPLKLSHLPPISMHVVLPIAYPLKGPPRISHLSSPWLLSMPSSHQSTCREWITDRLMEQWGEVKGEILWTWGEWLREGWVDEVVKGKEKTPFNSPVPRPRKASSSAIRLTEGENKESRTPAQGHGLAATLTAYDRLASQSAFDKDRFMCGICLEAKRGDSCVRVDACEHVFCRECMVDYLTLHLTEGSLHLAQSCPAPSCTARGGRNGAGQEEPSVAGADDQSAASPMGFISDEQMARIISSDGGASTDSHPLLTRLRFLKKKAEAEADPTAVPCPRPDCQTLTGAREEDKGTGGRWESFRQCAECGMSFCVWCRKTWHAPTPCALPSTSSLIEKYDASDAKGKLILERRYGRKNLLKLKAAYEEEKANQDWLKGKTQACPHCSCNVEKSFGCNHMTCGHCNTHFCYLCGTRINPAHPYLHFNTPGGKCFNRLFDGVLEREAEGGEDREGEEDEEVDNEDAMQRRREEEQHQLALAAIQAAYGE